MRASDTNEISGMLTSIVNFSDDAIISKTLEGTITTWNRGAEKIFGYSSEEAIGKNISIIIPDERIHEEARIIESIRQGEYIHHYETQRRKKDGTLIHISLTVSPIRDVNNTITAVLKIARDVTWQKAVEEIQSRMASIIKFSDDAILTKNLDGVITSWNRGAQKIFGYTANEVIGKHVSILIPDDRIDEEPQIIEKVRNREVIDHYETIRKRKDGELLHISLSISPILDGENNITGILKIARDITIRKKADEIQAWLASIINFSDDAIISKTLQGIITSWNQGAQKIFGYSSSEVIGKHVSILIPTGRLDEEPQIIDKISKGECIDHYETERVRKDGSIVQISLTVSPIKDSEGQIIGVSKIARDISEQKKRQEEIVQLNKELEAFSYSVSHDLKAPLRSIRSYAEILAEDYASKLDDYGRQTIASIVRNGERMTRLIDDLLEFSYRSAQDVVKTKVDMNELVHGILKEMMLQQSERKIDVQVNPLTPVSGDHSLLKVVWENFISNALKYTSKKETAMIEIGCSNPTNNMITYYIKDNGAGFDPKYDYKLFNVFQRLHNQRDFEGTGVGLATVQRIIIKHGGRVWAEGTINEGAAFFFSIPAS